VSAAPTLLQIVPTLSGGGLARATLDAAQAVIAAGGAAIVASPGGAMVPDLLRLRATHLELPDGGHPLWGRLMLPGKLASSLSEARVSLIQARSPNTAWVARALARRLGIKWIATLHTPFLAGSIAERFVERRQARADAVWSRCPSMWRAMPCSASPRSTAGSRPFCLASTSTASTPPSCVPTG
jgi:hypothetical protein